MQSRDDYMGIRALGRAMFRAGRLDSIRDAIRFGVYETPAKLGAATERILAELDEETHEDELQTRAWENANDWHD